MECAVKVLVMPYGTRKKPARYSMRAEGPTPDAMLEDACDQLAEDGYLVHAITFEDRDLVAYVEELA